MAEWISFLYIYSIWEGNGIPLQYPYAWKIPWTEEPGRLQSMGLLRVGCNWATSLFTFVHWRRKWQPTPVFLPGESQGRGAWWAAVYGVAQSRTRLKWLSSIVSEREYIYVCSYLIYMYIRHVYILFQILLPYRLPHKHFCLASTTYFFHHTARLAGF